MSAEGFLIVPMALSEFTAQAPETLMPDGAATLYGDWHGGVTAEGEHPELLTEFRVVVQPGGRAGTIRFLVHQSPAFGDQGSRAVYVGQPVTLPAEPGTYTFPAPHVLADYRDVGDEYVDPAVRGRRPPLSLEVPARPESIADGIPTTVRSTRKGTVRLPLRRGKRTYSRTLTLSRPGKRELRLRPRAGWPARTVS